MNAPKPVPQKLIYEFIQTNADCWSARVRLWSARKGTMAARKAEREVNQLAAIVATLTREIAEAAGVDMQRYVDQHEIRKDGTT